MPLRGWNIFNASQIFFGVTEIYYIRSPMPPERSPSGGCPSAWGSRSLGAADWRCWCWWATPPPWLPEGWFWSRGWWLPEPSRPPESDKSFLCWRRCLLDPWAALAPVYHFFPAVLELETNLREVWVYIITPIVSTHEIEVG